MYFISKALFKTIYLDETNSKRIVFNEITKAALKEAVKNPRDIDYDLVDAQQARRVLDRLVGYKISPVLWEKLINLADKKSTICTIRTIYLQIWNYWQSTASSPIQIEKN